jgi:hypothetical protein
MPHLTCFINLLNLLFIPFVSIMVTLTKINDADYLETLKAPSFNLKDHGKEFFESINFLN